MTQFDMRSIRKAPAAQISSKAESRKLFEGAETAANEHLAVPYSPIVLAGTVRMIELTLVALVGFAVYVAYVLPHDGFVNGDITRRRRINVVGLLTCWRSAAFWAALDASRAADTAHRDRRRRPARRGAGLRAGKPARFRRPRGGAFRRPRRRPLSAIDRRLRKLGNVDDLIEFARRTRVDLVLFSLPISAEGRILQMLKKLWVLPVDIRLSAHSNKLHFRPRSYSYLGNVPVLDVLDQPITDWDVVMKWLFDKIVSALALIALSPVMVLVALAIKLDSRGPVLFKQKRYGFNNELIEVYKFRSMYVEQSDVGASKLVSKGDPCVTRVGRFIRKTSLDELPQLFNVLFVSNLSLVGPRQHAVNAKAEEQLYDQAVDGYYARHRVKPGITGWAQINGWRGETDTHEKIQRRVEHDLHYIENWSVLFDLYILAKTPLALLKTENAY